MKDNGEDADSLVTVVCMGYVQGCTIPDDIEEGDKIS